MILRKVSNLKEGDYVVLTSQPPRRLNAIEPSSIRDGYYILEIAFDGTKSTQHILLADDYVEIVIL